MKEILHGHTSAKGKSAYASSAEGALYSLTWSPRHIIPKTEARLNVSGRDSSILFVEKILIGVILGSSYQSEVLTSQKLQHDVTAKNTLTA